MAIILGFAAAYLVLLGITLWRRPRRAPAEHWLLGYLVFSSVLTVIHALLLNNTLSLTPVTEGLVVLGMLELSVGFVILLTLSYLEASTKLKYWAGGLVGALLIAVVALTLSETPSVSLKFLPDIAGWFTVSIFLSTEIAVLGWLLCAVVLLVLIWRRFLTEPLPLHANRILFWGIVTPLIFAGDILVALGLNQPLNYIGFGVRILGVACAAYAVSAYRVPNLRNVARYIVSRFILTIIRLSLIVGAIVAVFTIGFEYYIRADRLRVDELNLTLLTIVAGLFVALVYPPVNRFFRWLLRGMIDRSSTDAAEAVRRYGQEINKVIDLAELADVATEALNDLLGTRRSILILATREKDKLILDRVGEQRAELDIPDVLMTDGLLYKRFINSTEPLHQYDLDYNRQFLEVPVAERSYFTSLKMDLFAPIVSNGEMIGFLAFGPKRNDDPFSARELELIEALAGQTVVSLENARLVANLRGLNEEISALVDDLKNSNERLERLDNVKSDFISIASHELRTPLTQVQGYSDLLNEMAERNILDEAEIAIITRNLSQATKRMTDVIAAMLDVSQIDVENMDLSFIQLAMNSVVKLAIEPYAEALQERGQVLVARGLTNLPPIHGDFTQLVKSFENLITNAIKFTPDGGKLNIMGQVYDKDEVGNPLSIRITIEDSGIGINPEHHELIFDKFFRVGSVALHSTGTTKFKGAGPGLGLSIVKGVVEGHGGRVWVESVGQNEELCPGSKFHVVLPIRPPAMEAVKLMEEIKLETGQLPPLPSAS